MNTIKTYIAIAFFFVSFAITAQISPSIVKEGNYTVTGTKTLIATQSITLKPNSWIKSGSTFSAKVSEDAYQTISLNENENYVFTRAFQAPITEAELLNPNVGIQNNADVIESITYFDGLGRPKQQIGIKASPDKKDIVTHISYDEYGRQDKQYLPFERQTGALGSYITVAINDHINNYYKTKYESDFNGVPIAEVNAYSQSIFEDSPLNRVLEQGAPGKEWKANKNLDTDHTIKFDWDTNTTNEVIYFKVNFHQGNSEVPILVKNGFYPPNELYITSTKDENWKSSDGNNHTTKEYKDKLGQVVLKRTYNEGESHDTYYVYDDFGNLTYVIPPKVTLSATDGVSTDELNELCYQYLYDYRNRLVEKKIPGKGREYIIYNRLDQPVLTQDLIQRPKREWLFTKYDAFGRVAYTGLYKYPIVTTRAGLQQAIDNATDAIQFENKQQSPSTIAGTTLYYTNNAFPGTGIQEIYTINYYDDYEIGDQISFNPANGSGTWEEMTASANVKGLPTVTRVKVLGTNKWITTATYYDHKGRPWETHTKNNYLGTEDWTLNKLDFASKVLKTQSMHTKNATTITTIDTFTYDHTGRLLTQTQKINNQATEQIVDNTYDELGQLESKETGGGLQDIDYKYNVRGWLTDINDVNAIGNDLFTFKINYATVEGRYNVPSLYNGNISQTIWKTGNDNTKRSYAYEYDQLNRIKNSYFRYNELLTEASKRSYELRDVGYDKNGNITAITRYDDNGTDAPMDRLSYTYDNDNKLVKVTDTGNDNGFKDGTNTDKDYEYDLNGNMTVDKNKAIQNIKYNHLNLPTEIKINHVNFINYTYDALGNKIEKKVSQKPTTYYAGNFIYQLIPGAGEFLQFINMPEGYIEPKNQSNISQGFEYIYQYKDHLGNIRLSYADKNNDGDIDVITGSAANEIIEEKNYYPFGLTHKGYNNTSTGRKHNYGYNGKEENDELGLEWLDFGARNYDAALGRWMNLDPLAEKYSNLSPFSYVANNVVNAIDPDGRLIIFIGGLRMPAFGLDQTFIGRSGFYETDDSFNGRGKGFRYWKKYGGKKNNFGTDGDLISLFSKMHNDNNHLFTSGSAGNWSSAKRRMRQGRRKARKFYERYMEGNVNFDDDDEVIRIVSHSQGGAHAAGFADQLLTYKDSEGNSLFNIEIIHYITPHQGADIINPGVFAFQYSHPNDAISGNGEGMGLFKFFNGGYHYGKIQNLDVDNFFESTIMGGEGQPEASGPLGTRNGHNATDNVMTIQGAVRSFCQKNPDKCKEIIFN